MADDATTARLIVAGAQLPSLKEWLARGSGHLYPWHRGRDHQRASDSEMARAKGEPERAEQWRSQPRPAGHRRQETTCVIRKRAVEWWDGRSRLILVSQ